MRKVTREPQEDKLMIRLYHLFLLMEVYFAIYNFTKQTINQTGEKNTHVFKYAKVQNLITTYLV